MFETVENGRSIRTNELQAGDVLLCRVPKQDFAKWAEQIGDLLLDILEKGYENIVPGDHIELIEQAIAAFDQSHYSHAAYFDGTQVIEEDLNHDGKKQGGVKRTDLNVYREYPSDVLRYQNDEHIVVGDGLSAEPLNASAEAIFKRIRKNPYGFKNALVLTALCINRMSQGPLIHTVESRLIAYFGQKWAPFIEMMFATEKDKIGRWMDAFMRDILYDHFDREDMVCSQFVAAIFNEAADQKAYNVTKPSHVKTARLTNTEQPIDNEEATSRAVQDIAALIQKLPEPPANTQLRPFELLQAAKGTIDTMYTPADFANSPNMIMKGLLEFPVGDS